MQSLITNSCKFCQQKFDISDNLPRLLPCAHSMCTFCIETHRNEMKNIACPTCFMIHSYVQQFPPHLKILQIMKNVKNTNEFDQDISNLNIYNIYKEGNVSNIELMRRLSELCVQGKGGPRTSTPNQNALKYSYLTPNKRKIDTLGEAPLQFQQTNYFQSNQNNSNEALKQIKCSYEKCGNICIVPGNILATFCSHQCRILYHSQSKNVLVNPKNVSSPISTYQSSRILTYTNDDNNYNYNYNNNNFNTTFSPFKLKSVSNKKPVLNSNSSRSKSPYSQLTNHFKQNDFTNRNLTQNITNVYQTSNILGKHVFPFKNNNNNNNGITQPELLFVQLEDDDPNKCLIPGCTNPRFIDSQGTIHPVCGLKCGAKYNPTPIPNI